MGDIKDDSAFCPTVLAGQIADVIVLHRSMTGFPRELCSIVGAFAEHEHRRLWRIVCEPEFRPHLSDEEDRLLSGIRVTAYRSSDGWVTTDQIRSNLASDGRQESGLPQDRIALIDRIRARLKTLLLSLENRGLIQQKICWR